MAWAVTGMRTSSPYPGSFSVNHHIERFATQDFFDLPPDMVHCYLQGTHERINLPQQTTGLLIKIWFAQNVKSRFFRYLLSTRSVRLDYY